MMTTKSPPSTWGAKVVLCLPRRRMAVWLARRPRTTSVASMTCHRHSTSCGLGVYVRTDKPSFSRGCETRGSDGVNAVSYTHLRAHETRHDLVCRLLLEKKKGSY